MGDAFLSIAYGPKRGDRNASHLHLFQQAIDARPNAVALIARHQSSSTIPWLGSRHADKDCLKWTYTELDRAARRLATTLNRLGHVGRRPIAALIQNQAEWALFFWAAAYLRAPFVPINPKIATRAEEINHVLDIVAPVMLVTANLELARQLEANVSEKLMSSIAVKMSLSMCGGDTAQPWTLLNDVVQSNQTPPDTPDVLEADDTTLILFTSGTTSLPKPCAITSFQCVNAALGCVDAVKIDSSHRLVQHLPSFHSYGIGWSLGFWLQGGTVIFPSDTFEPKASLACFDQFQATHMAFVPTTAQAILTHPAFAKTDLSTLASVVISGAGVLPSLINSCTNALKVPVLTTYGMTESPGTSAWAVEDGPVLRNGDVMCGKPVRNVVQKICEPGTRNLVPRGIHGELHNGGPQVISRYMDARVSQKDFYQDDEGVTWIVTGDQAVMDLEGAICITGRYKDMIIRGGENISPTSIEDYLIRNEAVFTAQVVAAPDEMAGEVPIAIITPVEGKEPNMSELKQNVTRDLGTAFAPKMILKLKEDLGLDAFPTTASGKVRKVELARIVREYLKAEQEKGLDTSGSTVDSIICIWKLISGADRLLPSTLIESFADSLMMMQLSGTVKKELHKDITVEAFNLCETIQDQANLIDAKTSTAMEVSPSKRPGPPTLQDMPHTLGNLEVFDRTKSDVSKMLDTVGLDWSDVEDVIPLPDWNSIFCHRSRPSSWNLRFTYYASVDVERLAAAIKASLEYHPTLRSMALEQDGQTLMVTVRLSKQWLKVAVTTGWEVQTKEDLKTLLLNDPLHDSAGAPGVLAKFHIAKVLDDGTSGVVFVSSHAVQDMTMGNLWLDDVTALLNGDAHIAPHVPFMDFATALFDHCDSAEANLGVDYWAKKYQGVSQLPESTFWPPQRAPEWFKGIDSGWSRWNGTKARETERLVLQSEKSRAQKGIRKMVRVDDITKLKAEHNVPVFLLVKAAIALMNVLKTKGKEALFGMSTAARTWPFSSDFNALEREAYAGNPLDISGNLVEYNLQRIPVASSKSVLRFMQQIVKDEEQNSKFSHTPFFRVVDRLRDPVSDNDTRTFAERERDAGALLPLIRRQSFNWLPSSYTAQDHKGLRFQEMLTRMDNGLTITGFLLEDRRSVALGFAWDAEHLNFVEAERALEELAGLVREMGKEENWRRSVGELLRAQ